MPLTEEDEVMDGQEFQQGIPHRSMSDKGYLDNTPRGDRGPIATVQPIGKADDRTAR